MVEARLSDWMSVSEAATALGITRQRVSQLIADGSLRASQAGNQRLVRREDVEARLDLTPGGGRRFSPRRAWALILLAGDVVAPGLDYTTLSRLRSVLHRQDLWILRSKLSSRAERRSLRAHSSDVARLLTEASVVRTGPRAAAEAGLGLVAPEAPIELYVDGATADRLVEHYSMRPSETPNVVLRVVPDEVRAWLHEPLAPRAAVALDLADDHDPRAQQVARDALSRP
jgi:excisionase family DNA binding protein